MAGYRGADVAELADALDSKSGTREGVGVRAPPSAPTESPGTKKKMCVCARARTHTAELPSLDRKTVSKPHTVTSRFRSTTCPVMGAVVLEDAFPLEA